MAVSVTCNSCEYRFQVEADLQGQRIRCPSCGDPLTLPGVPKNKSGSSRSGRSRQSVRRRAVMHQSSDRSRTMMAANIATTLIVVGIAAALLLALRPKEPEPEIIRPAEEETQNDSKNVPSDADSPDSALFRWPPGFMIPADSKVG